MNFLIKNFRNLFAGQTGSDRGLYIYVRPKRCDEIVRVRIDPHNDLSESEDGKGYFIRKTAQAARCPFAAEFTLRFDANRRMTGSSVENGELVTQADYDAWLAQHEQGVGG